jgi:hypothetical protein
MNMAIRVPCSDELVSATSALREKRPQTADVSGVAITPVSTRQISATGPLGTADARNSAREAVA